jgi:quinol monooxygenase YgiN
VLFINAVPAPKPLIYRKIQSIGQISSQLSGIASPASIKEDLTVRCAPIWAAERGSISMITRIVRMHFRPGESEAFLDTFNASKHMIRQFKGCQHLCLYNEAGLPDVFFTYSIWTSAAHLDAYRSSKLFRDTWTTTKALFADKAQAWSIKEVETVGVS